MINIIEKKSNKSPGITSLNITFKYDENILNVIKSCDGAVYHKKDKMWEVPCSELSKVIDGANGFDDIQLDLLKDKSKKEIEVKLNTKNFKTKPFPYQLEGIKYGLTHNKWLLLDQPGLGKTLQILYIAQLLKEQGKIEHCLIICGVNTLKTNWKKEIQKHTNLSCRILGERQRVKSGKTYFGGVKERLGDLKSDLNEFFIITNIETLRENDIIKEINNVKWYNDSVSSSPTRTIAGLREKARQGQYPHKAPIGYKNIELVVFCGIAFIIVGASISNISRSFSPITISNEAIIINIIKNFFI